MACAAQPYCVARWVSVVMVSHSSKLFALSADLPVIVEIIDSRKKISDFIALFDQVLHKGMATIEDVDSVFFGAASE